MMANGHRTEHSNDEYTSLENYIFALAPQVGITDCSVPDAPPSRSFEENMQGLIEEYDEDTFWMKLADKLAWMCALRDYSAEQISQMNGFDRLTILCDYEEKVNKYLQENGLEHFPLPNN